jgi:hypothetical protein
MEKHNAGGSESKDRGRPFAADALIRDWQSIGDLWLQPDPAIRDEEHLRRMESELAEDLERSVAAGLFNDEDKAALRSALLEGRRAADEAVAARIQRVIETL